MTYAYAVKNRNGHYLKGYTTNLQRCFGPRASRLEFRSAEEARKHVRDINTERVVGWQVTRA